MDNSRVNQKQDFEKTFKSEIRHGCSYCNSRFGSSGDLLKLNQNPSD